MQTRRGRAPVIVIVLAGSLALPFCSGKASPPAAQIPAGQEAAAQMTPAQPAAAESRPAEPLAQTPPAATTFSPERATGAVKGVPAPTNTAPIVAVANYFTEFPGIDLASLKPRQKEKFLQRVNSELCTCGCRNDTLARCYVNDPRCPVVKGMVQKVYEESKAGK